jgi:alpha-N-arabinofuranosidase
LQTIYHPLRLYAEHMQTTALDALVMSSPLPAHESFQSLDVAATRDADRRLLVLGVVNRHPTDAIETNLEVIGGSVAGAEVYEVNGPDVHATNSFAEPDTITTRRYEPSDAKMIAFPPHSVSLLRLRV